MGFLSDIMGGGKAMDAGEKQRQYGYMGQEEYRKLFGLSQAMLEPYNRGGLWALEQLIGPENTRAPVTPVVQGQVDAWKQWQSGVGSGNITPVKNAPGYIGGKNGWNKWKDKETYINRYRNELEAMLPTGMSVKDVPGWERWIYDPYPVDRNGQPIDESLWKYPSEAGTGTQATGGGLLQQGAPQMDFNAFKDSPWYTLQLNEGRKALESSAAGSGMLNSGNFGKALTRYGQDYAYGKAMDVHRQNVNDWVTTKLNPLLSVLSGGQVAGQQMSSQQVTNAQNQADLKKYQGEAVASGYLGQAAAQQAGIGALTGMVGATAGALTGMLGGAGGGSNALSSGMSGLRIGNQVGGGAGNDYGLSKYKTW